MKFNKDAWLKLKDFPLWIKLVLLYGALNIILDAIVFAAILYLRFRG